MESIFERDGGVGKDSLELSNNRVTGLIVTDGYKHLRKQKTMKTEHVYTDQKNK